MHFRVKPLHTVQGIKVFFFFFVFCFGLSFVTSKLVYNAHTVFTPNVPSWPSYKHTEFNDSTFCFSFLASRCLSLVRSIFSLILQKCTILHFFLFAYKLCFCLFDKSIRPVFHQIKVIKYATFFNFVKFARNLDGWNNTAQK